METKTVYRYDLQGYYIGPLTLDDSDRGPVTHDWQIPRNSTELSPEGLVPDEHHLIHWNKGDGAWELVENPNNPVPPEPEPPKPPTPEEKIAMLDADYTQQKNDLCTQYTDAQIHGDTETAGAIVDEMAALDAWYDEEYRKIVEEG